MYIYIYINSSDALSVLNTWLSAPEGFEKRDGGGILSASQAPTKYWIHTYKYTVSVLSIKTGEWENSKINCAQTQPADLTHTLGLIILLRRLLQKRALGKEAHLHQQTFFCKKTIFYVYILCVSCVSVSSVFPMSANSLKKPKKMSITCHQSNPPQRWLRFGQAPVCWSPAWPELLLDPASFMCRIPASKHRHI